MTPDTRTTVTTTNTRQGRKQRAPRLSMRTLSMSARRQYGKIGYIIFWLLGVPLPILFIIYLLRGCS